MGNETQQPEGAPTMVGAENVSFQDVPDWLRGTNVTASQPLLVIPNTQAGFTSVTYSGPALSTTNYQNYGPQLPGTEWLAGTEAAYDRGRNNLRGLLEGVRHFNLGEIGHQGRGLLGNLVPGLVYYGIQQEFKDAQSREGNPFTPHF